ncbi:class I SAM-dependent methyltransferase [Natrinema sp. 74]|uniref:class I SAM-dependent methyltransferase n=1 Tax=Natrinema sp. 74 TaxID=3384159 RepID=UPI0038D3B430
MSEGPSRTTAAGSESADGDSPTAADSSADPRATSGTRAISDTVLNVGAGEQGDGNVTLDLLSAVGPDVQGTATTLPFADETFDVVEMDQVLEHIAPERLGDVFEECYRVLRADGRLEAWVPHAASRLYDQDPTHRSRWTHGTPEYFADGNFSWYYDNRAFAFDLVDREVTVWVLEDAPLSGVRSVLLQTAHRLLEWDDGVVYRPSVSGSIHFTLRKV